jgi:hypothetical protein
MPIKDSLIDSYTDKILVRTFVKYHMSILSLFIPVQNRLSSEFDSNRFQESVDFFAYN